MPSNSNATFFVKNKNSNLPIQKIKSKFKTTNTQFFRNLKNLKISLNQKKIKNEPFSQFCLQYWSTLAPKTESTKRYRLDRVKNTKCYILPYFKNQKLKNITPQTIKNFLQYLTTQETRSYKLSKSKKNYKRNKYLAIGTIRIIRTTIMQPLQYAMENSLIPKNLQFQAESRINSKHQQKNYYKGMVAPRDIFTQSELDLLTKSEWNSDRAKMMFLIARYTGMRNGELRALRIKSIKTTYIEIESSYNNVDGTKCTKNGTSRRFPIFPELYNQIKDYIKTFPQKSMKTPESFVFPSFIKKNQPVGQSFANASLCRQMKKLNINRIHLEGSVTITKTFHSLRHCMDTYLTTNTTLGLSSISRLMGHSQTMVQHYSDHFNEDLFEQATKAISESPLWPKKLFYTNTHPEQNIHYEKELQNLYEQLGNIIIHLKNIGAPATA